MDVQRFEEFEESKRTILDLLAGVDEQPYHEALMTVFDARGRLDTIGKTIENEHEGIYQSDINRKVRDLRHDLMASLDKALAGGDLLAIPVTQPAASVLEVVAELLEIEAREAFFGRNHVNR